MNQNLRPHSSSDDILKERAKKLALEKEVVKDDTNILKVVEFKIANENYGIELIHIKVIHPLKSLTFIPGLPEFVKGIINVRGKIISVIDFKKFFTLPDQEITQLSQVIILTAPEMEFGILADDILGVKQISENEIQPTLPTLTGLRSDYLKGVTGNGLVILDGGKILADDKIVINLEAS